MQKVIDNLTRNRQSVLGVSMASVSKVQMVG